MRFFDKNDNEENNSTPENIGDNSIPQRKGLPTMPIGGQRPSAPTPIPNAEPAPRVEREPVEETLQSADELNDDLLDLPENKKGEEEKKPEPVFEILTPAIKVPTSSRDEYSSLQEQGIISKDEFNSDDDEKNEPIKEKKKRGSLFDRKNKDKKSEKSDSLLSNNLLSENDDDSDDQTDGEEKKAKKSLKEMTLSDLIPKKKDKGDIGIPLGENILIDLMPQSHKDVVETREAKRSWTGIFAAIVIGCVVVSGASVFYSYQTQAKVKAEQDRHAAIDLEIARHAEVNQAIQSESSARTLLDTAAGNEIDWNELITTIEGDLPPGTNIVSLNVTNGGGIDDEISSAITMNLSSTSTFGYSDSLRAVEGINGVQQVEIGGLSGSSDGGYSYTMSFTYDTSILTERFTLEEEAPAEETESTGTVSTDPALDELLNPNGELIDPEYEILDPEEG